MSKTAENVAQSVPRAILQQRWEAAWRAMEARGYDALVITGRGIITQYGNVRYFGGYPLFLFHGYVVLTPGEPPSLVLTRRDQELAEMYGVGDLVSKSGGDDDVTYGLRASDGLAPQVSEVLSQKGLENARIGVVGMGDIMPVSEYRALNTLLPNLVLEDASGLTAEIKAVKSEAELRLYHEAVAIADDAFGLFEGLVRVGADEQEIVAELERVVRSRGVVHSIIRVLPGLMNARPPIARTLVKGELNSCYVEIVAPNGFWVEKGGCFALGDLPSRCEEVYAASDRAFGAIEQLLTPGTRVSEIDRAVREVAREAGVVIGMRIGHGVGVDHDLPLIDADNESELEEGMVLAVHPLVQDRTYGAFEIDQYTVTASGPSRHSRFPRKLYRL